MLKFGKDYSYLLSNDELVSLVESLGLQEGHIIYGLGGEIEEKYNEFHTPTEVPKKAVISKGKSKTVVPLKTSGPKVYDKDANEASFWMKFRNIMN